MASEASGDDVAELRLQNQELRAKNQEQERRIHELEETLRRLQSASTPSPSPPEIKTPSEDIDTSRPSISVYLLNVGTLQVGKHKVYPGNLNPD